MKNNNKMKIKTEMKHNIIKKIKVNFSQAK